MGNVTVAGSLLNTILLEHRGESEEGTRKAEVSNEKMVRSIDDCNNGLLGNVCFGR